MRSRLGNFFLFLYPPCLPVAFLFYFRIKDVCVGVCDGEEIPRILLTARKETKMIRGNTQTQQHVGYSKALSWIRLE